MQFLTVGTDHIRSELFIPIQDPEDADKVKPVGGLWLTPQNMQHPNFNIWVDFILQNLHIMFFKSTNKNPFKQKAALVTLKNTARIYTLNNGEDYAFLCQHYPDYKKEFSYEYLSKDYDGIYISENFWKTFDDEHKRNQYRTFGVESLILFNPKCIEYFQKAVVDITPFDYEYPDPYEAVEYVIQVEEEKQYIAPPTLQYNELFDIINIKIAEYLYERSIPIESLTKQDLYVIVLYIINANNHSNLLSSEEIPILARIITTNCL